MRDGFGTDARLSPHTRATLEAVLVTVLWASSYVLVKLGLREIPPLTFAGLRYSLAAAILVLVVGYDSGGQPFSGVDRRQWAVLLGLGLTLYAVTQGAQFVALNYLQVATIGLVLNFTPVVVAIIAAVALDERPRRGQLVGMALLVGGVLTYFHPVDLGRGQLIGLGVMIIGLFGNALGSVFGRALNRSRALSPINVTTISMAVGGSVLLVAGVTLQGLPPLSATGWAIVGWLAVINTALAFTLWNRTLQRLTAVESSVINNTILIQIAILGWVFLGETLSVLDIAGLGLVALGALVVQLVGRW